MGLLGSNCVEGEKLSNFGRPSSNDQLFKNCLDWFGGAVTRRESLRPEVVLHHRAERMKFSSVQQAVGRRLEKERLPDEVGAVAAESRLPEEPGCEFVVLHFVDVFLPQSTFTRKPVRHVLGERLVYAHNVSHGPLKKSKAPVRSANVFSPLSRAQRRSSLETLELWVRSPCLILPRLHWQLFAPPS